ncbi:S8 family serine peptidase [Flavobacterium kingsejongi]|uniref:Peptidase S8 n=1 Tax=Flavobacterium kingsejongi TaxID=1678728 RepID=A0A2S1LJ22_9FLAO|nr:S8 family serine peptidase [Flavobacterium kingsejongi]AWG23764.1 hypothetical protein FK004_00245 [Flavobacterium kingsejongi]
MKKNILLLLLFPGFVFAQNNEQRSKIIAAYNEGNIKKLKSKVELFQQEQAKMIANYKSQFKVVDSEQKSLQRIFNGEPVFFTIGNAGASRTISANKLYPGGGLNLNITGSGMVAGVWDGADVRTTHQEFVDKVTITDGFTATLSDHSTHVTGTILATGISPDRRGIAYNASARTNNWTNDVSEMIGFAQGGYLVSNHSYGYQAETLANWRFGKYDDTSATMDEIMHTFPYYLIVSAAGNDRATTSISQVTAKNGYDLLTGMGTSKNGLTVAAVSNVDNYVSANSVIVSNFTNFGPTDDGRIKPDISAKGVNVNSTISTSDTSYGTMSGTSMATPGITGLVVLLQDYYNTVNSHFMKAATVRGLICHTAKEAGAGKGPDYRMGWGLADGEKAALLIRDNGTGTFIDERNLLNNETFTKVITINQAQDIEVSITWTDPEGQVNNNTPDDRTARLVNNLDLKITNNGTTYYPWKLNPLLPVSKATQNSDNDVDNIEKVHIYNAQPGTYTIQVTHKGTLAGGSQEYSMIGNVSGGTLGINDVSADKSIFIYPNPANDRLNFTLPQNLILSDVIVYDITGKVVVNKLNAEAKQIDVSQLGSGVYFVKFISEDKSITKKFVKK